MPDRTPEQGRADARHDSADRQRPPRYLTTSIWGDPEPEIAPPAGFPLWLESYRYEQPLGDGGMGVVCRYRDTLLDRMVAVKTMPDRFTADADMRERFRREAQALAALDHANIGRIHHGVEDAGRLYLVLEYVPGRTLRALLAAGALPIERALHIAFQIARAIEAGHERRIIHRDVKPENVMVTPGEVAKLLDYGLVRFFATPDPEDADRTLPDPGAPGRTHPGRVMGTAGYMSPEQVRGEPTDERTDVWAFGCVLFECLAGVAAFPGASRDERNEATLRAAPPWERLPGRTPAPIRRLLEACLEKDRARRTLRITDLRAELAAVRKGDGAERAAGPVPTNLPTELTPFVGRSAELDLLRRQIHDRHLVTITGTGGAGKTRLALELARRSLIPEDEWAGAAPFPDGVFIVELTRVTRGEGVPAAVAAVVMNGSAAPNGRAVTETLVDRLRPRRTLIILDNSEHLGPGCAALVKALLRDCPDLRIVATSREPLGLDFEQTHALGGLPVPGHDVAGSAIDDWDAVRLFALRAERVRPGFALSETNRGAVAEICRRLEGIPLAIELAAARLATMPVSDVERRLLEVLDRDEILHSSIDWSVKLLRGPARRLLGRLSVFKGGWTLEAAEEVCGDDGTGAIDGTPVIDLLGKLVLRSLVMYEERADRARYHLLEVVGRYCREHLADEDERSALSRRHLAYFRKVAVDAERSFKERAADVAAGRRRAAWIDRLDAEHDNFRSALDLASDESIDPDAAAEICTALYVLWDLRGTVDEGRARLDRALARRAGARDRLEMKTLAAAGTIATHQRDGDAARRFYGQALELADAICDQGAAAGLHTNLGRLARAEGDLAESRRCHEEALRMYEAVGDRYGTAMVRLNLGNTATLEHRFDEAHELLSACIDEFRERGDERRIATAQHNLARIACSRGAADEAMPRLHEAFDIRRRLGDRAGIAATVLTLGIAHQMSGNYERAAHLLRLSEAMHHAADAPISPLDREEYERSMAIVRKNLGEKAFTEAQSDASVTGFEYAVAFAAELVEPERGE